MDKCGLCGGDPFKKDNFKDAVLRLIPYVTASSHHMLKFELE